jgi:tetratricopeptide (TPR) repeat protein
MSTLNVELDAAVIPYNSLTSLRAEHAKLLTLYKEGETEGLLNDLHDFRLRASATGGILDNENDRAIAQSLIDYWMTILYRARRTPPYATLAEFDPLLLPELDDNKCPYLGLDAFQEKDRHKFFGRQHMVEQIIDKIREARLLFVVGPSGSGKSSLVLAGVVPSLKNDIISGSKKWKYVPTIVPGRKPLKNLVVALGNTYKQTDEWVKQQIEELKRDPGHLVKVLSQFTDVPAVIVVDQFEELFTLDSPDASREEFIRSLVSLSESPGARHVVIITLRTDFEDDTREHPVLKSHFDKNKVDVTLLSATDLREAIERPAKDIDLRFEDGVVDALVKDILGEPEGLPLLQFTLLRLWKTREGGRSRITLRQYNKLGGARQALRSTADEFYESLTEVKKQTVEKIMLKMVRLVENRKEQGGADNQDITYLEALRKPVSRKVLYVEAAHRVDEVLEGLREAGLVRITSRDAEAGDKVEVAHETLLRNWPKLKGWIKEKKDALSQRGLLTTQAKQWLDHNKDAGSLLRGQALREARQHDDLNDLEKEFVQASEEAVEQAENDNLARMQELERESREKDKKAKKLHQALAICVILALLAVAFAGMVLSAMYYSTRKVELAKRVKAADALFENHQLGEAIEEYEKLLASYFRPDEYSGEAEDMGHVLSRLSIIYKMQRDELNAHQDTAGAEAKNHLSGDMYRRAQEIFLRALGKAEGDEIKTLTAYQKLAEFYKENGELDAAQGVYEEALDIQVRSLTSNAARRPSAGGHTPLDVFGSYKKLGEFFIMRGKSEEAAEKFEQGLKFIEQAQDQNNNVGLGEALTEHLSYLGDFYKSLGDFEKARVCYEKALLRHGIKSSPENQNLENRGDKMNEALATLYSKLGDLQVKLKDYEAAVPNYEKAMTIYNQKPYSPERQPNIEGKVATAIAAADILLMRKRDAEAKDYYYKAIKVLNDLGEKRTTEQKDQLADSRIKIACIDYMAGVKSNPAEAEKQAVDLIKSALTDAPSGPTLLDRDLRVLLKISPRENFKKERSGTPEKPFEQLLTLYYKSIRDKDRGSTDTLDESIRALDAIYRAQGNTDKLIALYERVLEIRKKTSDLDDSSLYSAYDMLGQLYLAKNRYKDAEVSHLGAYDTAKSASEKKHVNVDEYLRNSLENLIEVYRKQRNYSEVRRREEEAHKIRSKQADMIGQS